MNTKTEGTGGSPGEPRYFQRLVSRRLTTIVVAPSRLVHNARDDGRRERDVAKMLLNRDVGVGIFNFPSGRDTRRYAGATLRRV